MAAAQSTRSPSSARVARSDPAAAAAWNAHRLRRNSRSVCVALDISRAQKLVSSSAGAGRHRRNRWLTSANRRASARGTAPRMCSSVTQARSHRRIAVPAASNESRAYLRAYRGLSRTIQVETARDSL